MPREHIQKTNLLIFLSIVYFVCWSAGNSVYNWRNIVKRCSTLWHLSASSDITQLFSEQLSTTADLRASHSNDQHLLLILFRHVSKLFWDVWEMSKFTEISSRIAVKKLHGKGLNECLCARECSASIKIEHFAHYFKLII